MPEQDYRDEDDHHYREHGHSAAPVVVLVVTHVLPPVGSFQKGKDDTADLFFDGGIDKEGVKGRG